MDAVFSQTLIRKSNQIGVGSTHACGIKTDNTVACWGSSIHGQTIPSSSSQSVDQNTKFLSISAGGPADNSSPISYTCGIKTSNDLACWGFGRYGQTNPTSSPQGVSTNTKFLAVSAGGYHACGIKTNNELACWGLFLQGQTMPIHARGVDAETKFLAVSAGGYHTCGIKIDNELACWGFGRYGQTIPSSSPQGVSTNTKFLAVSAGHYHSCGIKMDRTVACWGWSEYGQTMPGQTTPIYHPQDVDENTKFLAVSAGGRHTCGIKTNNELACWGYNGLDGRSNPPYSKPQFFQKHSHTKYTLSNEIKADFLAISAGAAHSCAVELDGTPLCWGLGIAYPYHLDTSSTPVASSTPTIVGTPRTKPSFIGFQEALITPDTFYLFEKTQIIKNAVEKKSSPLVKVYTDSSVALENGTVPIFIKAVSALKAASTGTEPVTVNLSLNPETTLAVLSTSSVQLTKEQPTASLGLSVADNFNIQANNVTFIVSLTSDQADISPQTLSYTIPPNDLINAHIEDSVKLRDDGIPQTIMVEVPNLEDTKTFIVSSDDPRVIVSTGFVMARNQDPFPVTVRLREGAQLDREESLHLTINHLDAFSRNSAEIGSSSYHSCAIKRDGVAVCWGSSLTGPDIKFLSISAGWYNTCGIKTDNTVVCWGAFSGDQANLISGFQGAPANTRFLSVSAGEAHNCGIKEDGTAECEGNSSYGQTDPSNAEGVDENTKFLAISAGESHNCGIKIDSTMACWGHSGNNRTDPPGGEFLAVSAGEAHNCAIKKDRTVACWGLENDNRTDPISSPQGVDQNTKFLAVSAGSRHSCGIKIDRTIACWGYSEHDVSNPAGSPQGIDEKDEFLAISAGHAHTCAIKAEGTAACWGFDDTSAFASGYTYPPADFKARAMPDTLRLFEYGEVLTDVVTISPPEISFHADRSIIPEGTTAYILVRSVSQQPSEHRLILQESDPTMAVLSDSSIRVTKDRPSLISLFIKDNNEMNGDSRIVTVRLTIPPELRARSDSLSFTIPPDDLSAEYDRPAEFAIGKTVQTVMIHVPDLEDAKTFMVSSGDTRVIVPTGFIMARNQDPFPVTVRLREGAQLDREESLHLTINHLDAFSRNSAEISAGGTNSCGIKTDGTMACWGSSANDKTNPSGSPQGVNQNTKFLAVSTGGNHSCGIKADGTMACWGFSGNPSDGRTETEQQHSGCQPEHPLSCRQRRTRTQLRHQDRRHHGMLGLPK